MFMCLRVHVFMCLCSYAFALTRKHINTLTLVFFFSSCNQQSNQIPVLGSLDTAAIAMDTVMQKGFESSYEFHKTLTVHEKLVYDVVGYGGPSSNGEYAILRRGADNKADTIMKGKREGIIVDAVITDVYDDENEKVGDQVYLIIQQTGRESHGNVIGKYLDGARIEFNQEFPESFDTLQYRGRDTFYFTARKLYREFPLYKNADENCCPTNGKMKISYTLIYSDLQIEKMERLR